MEVDVEGQPEPEVDDDSMPGFYEEEPELDDLGHDDQSMESSDDTLSTLSKPHSKPHPGINGPSLLGTSSRDIHQSSGSGLPGEVISPEHHTCPICSKSLKTDNQGLNAHIDFCLSKNAILEAQAEASTPKKQGLKPKSKGRG